MVANRLPKKGIGELYGFMHYEVFRDGVCKDSGSLIFFREF